MCDQQRQTSNHHQSWFSRQAQEPYTKNYQNWSSCRDQQRKTLDSRLRHQYCTRDGHDKLQPEQSLGKDLLTLMDATHDLQLSLMRKKFFAAAPDRTNVKWTVSCFTDASQFFLQATFSERIQSSCCPRLATEGIHSLSRATKPLCSLQYFCNSLSIFHKSNYSCMLNLMIEDKQYTIEPICLSLIHISSPRD